MPWGRPARVVEVPAEDCTCGIYATADLTVVDQYPTAEAPVLGVVSLHGRVIPGVDDDGDIKPRRR
jgi:hypothetical protein